MKRIRYYFLMMMITLFGLSAAAQVVISDDGSQNADANAVLTVDSDTKALLLPRVPLATLFGMTSPTKGLISYSSDQDAIYYNDGTGFVNGWVSLLKSGSSMGELDGIIYQSASSEANIAIGGGSEGDLHTTALGYLAGEKLSVSSPGAQDNTLMGYKAGYDIQGGVYNTAVGSQIELRTGSGPVTRQHATVVGYDAEAHTKSVVVGSTAKSLDTNGIAIGYGAQAHGGSIVLGVNAASTAVNQIILGPTGKTLWVPSLAGTYTGGQAYVIVNDNGQLEASDGGPSGPWVNELQELRAENARLIAQMNAMMQQLEKHQQLLDELNGK